MIPAATRVFARWGFLLVLAAVPLLAWSAASTPVAEHTLANGMRVIVKTDRRAPVVVSMVWYKVGSMDEVNGTTGVAHVLEHMMFKGTKAVPAGEFSRIIAEAGGRDNAFTSRDYTGYFPDAAQIAAGARDEARSRPHDEPRALAGRIQQGNQGW